MICTCWTNTSNYAKKLRIFIGKLSTSTVESWLCRRCIVHLGHRAMARPIIEGIPRVRARELVMSRISRVRFWPTVVNSCMRTRDYLPCREFERAWIGLTRVCVYATIDNVANSHAHNLSKLARAHTRLGHVAKFARATLVKLQTRVYANLAIDHVANLYACDFG